LLPLRNNRRQSRTPIRIAELLRTNEVILNEAELSFTGCLANGGNHSVDNASGKTAGFSAAWIPNPGLSLATRKMNRIAAGTHTVAQ
jgi:hypothetical protein